jgi:hypothetical protein
MAVNQNYELGWHLMKGRGRIFSRSGLVGVILPGRTENISNLLKSSAFILGLIITGQTFIATFAAWLYEWCRRAILKAFAQMRGSIQRSRNLSFCNAQNRALTNPSALSFAVHYKQLVFERYRFSRDCAEAAEPGKVRRSSQQIGNQDEQLSHQPER